MQKFPSKEFPTSVVIFEENSVGDSAYILKEGRVEISMKIRGKKNILAELNPITIFGEMALLSKEKRRTATAITLSHVEVIEINKANFDELVSQSPSVIASVLRGITQRFVDTISLLNPGYVERRGKNSSIPVADRREPTHPIPGAVELRSTGPLVKYDRMKIQLVHTEQKISKQPLSGYRYVRLVTQTKNEGVRVDYFDGEIEWFPINTIVYVLG